MKSQGDRERGAEGVGEGAGEGGGGEGWQGGGHILMKRHLVCCQFSRISRHTDDVLQLSIPRCPHASYVPLPPPPASSGFESALLMYPLCQHPLLSALYFRCRQLKAQASHSFIFTLPLSLSVSASLSLSLCLSLCLSLSALSLSLCLSLSLSVPLSLSLSNTCFCFFSRCILVCRSYLYSCLTY